MGSANRIKPERLPEKLLSIRKTLSLTQPEIAEELSFGNIKLRKSDISRYESGSREPPLGILLRYSRLSRVSLEELVDDELELQ